MTFCTSSLNSGTLYLQTFAVCHTSFGRLLFAAYNMYTGCPLKKVGAVVGSMEESRRTKKSYTILPISQ